MLEARELLSSSDELSPRVHLTFPPDSENLGDSGDDRGDADRVAFCEASAVNNARKAQNAPTMSTERLSSTGAVEWCGSGVCPPTYRSAVKVSEASLERGIEDAISLTATITKMAIGNNMVIASSSSSMENGTHSSHGPVRCNWADALQCSWVVLQAAHVVLLLRKNEQHMPRLRDCAWVSPVGELEG
eukprot:m.126244 g.126244  ORF g.126244 m.126244 type:complete len:188 (+) comp17365_c0_seq1:357-920(+)